MINRRFFQAVRRLLVLTAAGVSIGCTPDDAQLFNYGEPRAEFRLVVELQQPIPRNEFVGLASQMMKDGGLADVSTPWASTQIGKPGEPTTESYPMGYGWSFDGSDRANQFRTVIMVENQGSEIREFLLQVIYDHPGPLTVDDWVVAANWANSLVPEHFPSAIAKFSRHPIEFTDAESVAQFAARSGLQLPSER